MATQIKVETRTVMSLLTSGRERMFLIPDYQRPYAWDYEKIDTLFQDIKDFSIEIEDINHVTKPYFLGSIVSYKEDDKIVQGIQQPVQSIIDGQQRLTSLILLLRAIYKRLSEGEDSQSPRSQKYLKDIAPCIWFTSNVDDSIQYDKILIYSEVMDDMGNAILHDILSTGNADPKAKDNYSKNYLRFLDLYDNFCKDSPNSVTNFLYAILNLVTLLNIDADELDMALTIFSTLNNRGLPLSDADIFKAELYKKKKTEKEKNDFIEEWKELARGAEEANIDIQQLFTYYMYYLRALEKDTSTSVIGVRKYFGENNKYLRFDKYSIMKDLNIILVLWRVINIHEIIEDEPWTTNMHILKILDILLSFPNEWWKYPVITYYITYRSRNDFEQLFLIFLCKLTEDLMSRYLVNPTVNSVKSFIPKLTEDIANTNTSPLPVFPSRDIEIVPDERIIEPHYKMVSMLLKVYAYHNPKQENLLEKGWQIEHILPRKWSSTFFLVNTTPDTINRMIEHIGNKTPLEWKLNISAKNGYFKEKIAKYKNTRIVVTHELTEFNTIDWTLEHIKLRDEIFTTTIHQQFKKWSDEYDKAASAFLTPVEPPKPQPTPEQQAQIEELRRLGLI